MAAAAAVLLLAGLGPPAGAYPRPGRTVIGSLTASGGQVDGFNDSSTEWPALTPDGRYLAFYSRADNIVPQDTDPAADIYVRDLATGRVELASPSANGTGGDRDSFAPRITPDARYVAFESWASDLLADGDEGWADVFVYDRQTGSMDRISRPDDGTGMNDESSFHPAISDDGRYVAFESDASTITPADHHPGSDVFVRDRQTGTVEIVSLTPSGGAPDGPSFYAYMSANARFVEFNSRATNLVSPATNGHYQDFVRDRLAGSTTLVTAADDGTQGNDDSGGGMISADGSSVAFSSFASNLVPNDANGHGDDVFVRNLSSQHTELVSVSSSGVQANGPSSLTAFSRDGRYVVFWSDATNLVPGDTNGQRDVFVHDMITGTTELVSQAADPAGGDAMSWGIASVTPGGRDVAFMSSADNIVPDDTNGAQDIFVRDRGPELGVGPVDAQRTGSGIRVTGWATFSGDEAASATDTSGDTSSAATGAGADLTRATVVERPESGDLFVRLELASMPSLSGPCASLACAPSAGGLPAVVYGFGLTVKGVHYEVRANPAPGTGGTFTLERCDAQCQPVTGATVTGSIGSTGTRAVLSIPFSAVGASPGDPVTGMRAFTRAQPGTTDASQLTLDDLALPNAVILVPRLEMAIGAQGAGPPDAGFDTVATLADGSFDVTLPAGTGPAVVWARACFGICNTTRAADVS